MEYKVNIHTGVWEMAKLYGSSFSILKKLKHIVGIICSFSIFISTAINAQSTPITAGYRTISFSNNIVGEPTGEKPESKIWWNDGAWWG